jgi:hypothetical protein
MQGVPRDFGRHSMPVHLDFMVSNPDEMDGHQQGRLPA